MATHTHTQDNLTILGRGVEIVLISPSTHCKYAQKKTVQTIESLLVDVPLNLIIFLFISGKRVERDVY